MLLEHREGEKKAIMLFDEGIQKISDPELNWFLGKMKLDEVDHLKEIDALLSEYGSLKKVITISSKIEWHDDYAGDDSERPWIE